MPATLSPFEIVSAAQVDLWKTRRVFSPLPAVNTVYDYVANYRGSDQRRILRAISQQDKDSLMNDFFSESYPLPQSSTCEEIAIAVADHPLLSNLDATATKIFYRCANNGHIFLIISGIAIVDSSFCTTLSKAAIDSRFGGLNPAGGIYISREKVTGLGYGFRRAPPPSTVYMKNPTIFISHPGPLSSQDISYFPRGMKVVRPAVNSNTGCEMVSVETARRQGFQNVFNQRDLFDFPLRLLVRSYARRQCVWLGKITISSACLLTVLYFNDQSATQHDMYTTSELDEGLECCRKLLKLRLTGDSSRIMDVDEVEGEIATIMTTFGHIGHMQA